MYDIFNKHQPGEKIYQLRDIFRAIFVSILNTYLMSGNSNEEI